MFKVVLFDDGSDDARNAKELLKGYEGVAVEVRESLVFRVACGLNVPEELRGLLEFLKFLQERQTSHTCCG